VDVYFVIMMCQKYCFYVFFHTQVLQYLYSSIKLMLNYIAYEMQCTYVLYILFITQCVSMYNKT
jgi:hypothetical protein